VVNSGWEIQADVRRKRKNKREVMGTLLCFPNCDMLRLQVPRSARFYLLAAVAVTTLLYAGQWLATQYEPDSSLVLYAQQRGVCVRVTFFA